MSFVALRASKTAVPEKKRGEGAKRLEKITGSLFARHESEDDFLMMMLRLQEKKRRGRLVLETGAGGS